MGDSPTVLAHPSWCDGQHPVLYQIADEPSERDHYREVGRVNDGGPSVIVVGISMTAEDLGDDSQAAPSIQILHLLDNGDEVPELLCGEAHLSASEACTLAPLLIRAAEILKAGQR
ncbi:hypothetical protein AB0C69_28480 [Actinomadura sp. NPDC048032]|uniref:hypothetical protein n=1 Tax=Actinomadura sp. NPDC048032 TaxID=3155747 RepID=UPI0033E33E71